MPDMFFTVLIYSVAVLGAWLALSTLLALAVGRGIHMADEYQAHPEPESLRDAA